MIGKTKQEVKNDLLSVVAPPFYSWLQHIIAFGIESIENSQKATLIFTL